MILSAATSLRSNAGESPPPQKKKPNPTPSSSSSSLLLKLPNEITLNILARVPRRYHSSISLVSKTLNRLISSPEIHIERSVSRNTEPVLHVVLRSHATETPLWFTLNPKPFPIGSAPIPSIGNGNENPIPSIADENNRRSAALIPTTGNEYKNPIPSIGNGNSHRLVPIPSFPSIPCWGMSIIAIESAIYILGGCGINDELVTTAFVVQSGTNTCRLLPNMKEPRGCAAAGIVDGKLFVIGGCDPQSENWIEAFDLQSEIWETVMIDSDDMLNVEMMHERTIRSFVMNDKIYIMDRKKSFVYDPKNGRFEYDPLVDTQWSVGSCVIDDRLFSFGNKNTIVVFDPISRVWSCVKGLEDLPERCDGSRMANQGGRLVVLYDVKRFSTELWCTEIELERRGENGEEIWGKVLWNSVVVTFKDSYTIVRSLEVAL